MIQSLFHTCGSGIGMKYGILVVLVVRLVFQDPGLYDCIRYLFNIPQRYRAVSNPEEPSEPLHMAILLYVLDYAWHSWQT